MASLYREAPDFVNGFPASSWSPLGPRRPLSTTSLEKPKWVRSMGTAARGAKKELRRAGFRVVADPESFLVSDTRGPLLAGEGDRARRWGEMLASQFAAMAQEQLVRR